MGYITIDVGTTNTRIRYIKNNKIMATYRSNTGVRDTAIKGSTRYLEHNLKDGIKYCLNESGKNIKDIDGIIATGMITSNLGIYEIHHLETPVSMNKISKEIKNKVFDNIVDYPIHFIPGVKNKVKNLSINSFQDIDMMRGEEVEAFGAATLYPLDNKTIYISPGSHTKFVFMDKDKSIEKCSTTLTGEILWALSQETILASSINKDLVTYIDEDYVKKGIESVQKHGFTKTCFSVRLMDTFLETNANQRANFLSGALLYQDIMSINNEIASGDYNIIIGGKSILRGLYYLIISQMDYDMSKVKILNDDEVEILSSLGAIEIFNLNK